jgi:hypothetical protein
MRVEAATKAIQRRHLSQSDTVRIQAENRAQCKLQSLSHSWRWRRAILTMLHNNYEVVGLVTVEVVTEAIGEHIGHINDGI